MNLALDPVEVRLLGCLIEKRITTPDHYPLSLNALELACNQTTNRDPVTGYDPTTIERATESLRQKELLWVVRGGRATKYDHRLAEKLSLDAAGLAALCVLMLRGAQTAGEIRGRSGRLHEFADVPSVEETLDALMRREPPLAAKLPRLPGTKEFRFQHLLAGAAAADPLLVGTQVARGMPPEAGPPSAGVAAEIGEDRVSRLESQLAAAVRRLGELERRFEDLERPSPTPARERPLDASDGE